MTACPGDGLKIARTLMPIEYVTASLHVSTGAALFAIGLAKLRFENEGRAEQEWARQRAYYEIPFHQQLS